jgi:hypothetical protein
MQFFPIKILILKKYGKVYIFFNIFFRKNLGTLKIQFQRYSNLSNHFYKIFKNIYKFDIIVTNYNITIQFIINIIVSKIGYF